MSFCLSYVHDDLGFLQESSKNKSAPFFARELLKAQPLVGIKKYRQILEDNEWVKLVHKTAYLSKMRDLSCDPSSDKQSHHDRFVIFARWADGVAFVMLSGYLKIRAYLTNNKLRSEGREFRVFEPVMSEHSCMYISNLYRWLQQLWSGQRQETSIRTIE